MPLPKLYMEWAALLSRLATSRLMAMGTVTVSEASRALTVCATVAVKFDLSHKGEW